MQADLKVVVDELIDLYNNPEPIKDYSVNPLPSNIPCLFIIY